MFLSGLFGKKKNEPQKISYTDDDKTSKKMKNILESEQHREGHVNTNDNSLMLTCRETISERETLVKLPEEKIVPTSRENQFSNVRTDSNSQVAFGVEQKKSIPIEVLVKKQRKLIFDDSAVNCLGFSNFIKKYTSTIEKSKNTFFLPNFILPTIDDKMAYILKPFIDSMSFSVFKYDKVDDYNKLLSKISGMGSEKGRLCFIVNSFKSRQTILNAAKEAGIFVQFVEINNYGELCQERKRQDSNKLDGTNTSRKGTLNSNAFQLSLTPVRMAVKSITLRKPIQIGSILHDSNGNLYKLVKKEIVSANSITYSTNDSNTWANVYAPASLNTFFEEKCKLMVSKKVSYKGLCWPIDLLYNEEGKFIGTLVKPAKGQPLHLAIFKQGNLQKLFPNWDKKNLCDLTITILDIIEYLHSMNILMGCINPAAIRIVNSNEVYFVDTDNYQIEGFPPLVYNTTFTPPEFLRRKMYLCDKSNENYAIAMLTFMLMLPGKLPYTVDNERNAVESIKQKQFPFPNGKAHGNHTLPGMWRFMWSHLTPFKEPFYQTFQSGGNYEKTKDRLNVTQWKQITERFRRDLERPLDDESLKLFPVTFKRGKDAFYKCNYCGIEYPEFFFNHKYFHTHRICNMCIDKMSNVSFTCQACHRVYFYTHRTALFHEMKQKNNNWKKQKYCSDCKRKTLECPSCHKIHPYYEGDSDGYCRDCHKKCIYRTIYGRCGHHFTITYGEHEFLMDKGLSDPTRCPVCRKQPRY